MLIITIIVPCCISCGTNTTDNGKPKIVVTYAILGSIVKELVGDQADVIVSIPNGTDPHVWEPSAKDIETINKADLVVQNGLGLESGMLQTLQLAQQNGVKFFTASDYIDIRYVGPNEGIPTGDPDQAIGAPDPHLWMDPLAMESVVTGLRDFLKNELNLDISAKAELLKSRLDILDSQVNEILSVIPQENRKLVTGHESMGYFARRYNFTLIGVIIPSLSSQANISAGDMANLIKIIQDNHVKAIFTELGTSAAQAKAIGDATGVEVVTLTGSILPEDGSYSTFLTDVANTIAEALK